MEKAYSYLRTSGDDGRDKAGLPVQREACAAFAKKTDREIAQEFEDDGITGKLHMHQRPQGKLLIAALLGNGVRTVLTYDAKRIGRTQPAYWNFIGLCRDSGIAVLDASGTNLCESVMGGVHGMLAEMDHGSYHRSRDVVQQIVGEDGTKTGFFHLDWLRTSIADRSGLSQTRMGCGVPGLLLDECSGAAWPCFDRRRQREGS